MNAEIQAILSRYDLPNNILLGDLSAHLTGDELARVHYLLKYPNEKTEPKGGGMTMKADSRLKSFLIQDLKEVDESFEHIKDIIEDKLHYSIIKENAALINHIERVDNFISYWQQHAKSLEEASDD